MSTNIQDEFKEIQNFKNYMINKKGEIINLATGKNMKIIEALKRLDKKSTILQNMSNGNLYQRYSQNVVWETITSPKDNVTGRTLQLDDFLKNYINDDFQELSQWYHQDIKFPILCKVSINGNYKILNFISKSGDWFHTGLAESYEISIHNKITPLSDSELDLFKRGF